MHRRQRAGGVRRPRAARGAGCPRRRGVCGLGGRGTSVRDPGRPGVGPATRPASPSGDPESIVRADSSHLPARPPLPPRFQPFRSAPTSGARPAALARAGLSPPLRRLPESRRVGRAERTEDCVGGGRAHFCAQPARGSLQAGKTAVRRSAPTRRSPAPNQLDWPPVDSVPPPAKSHWTLRKWRVVRSPGGRELSARRWRGGDWSRRESWMRRQPQRTRPSEPDRTRQRTQDVFLAVTLGSFLIYHKQISFLSPSDL